LINYKKLEQNIIESQFLKPEEKNIKFQVSKVKNKS